MKIKKGDKVKVILGKDRGREGTVEKVLPKKNAVTISGLNIYKKAIRPKKEGDKGGIVEIARPLNVSKVMLVCPKCHQPTRVAYSLTNGGKAGADGKNKIRICRKCREVINNG